MSKIRIRFSDSSTMYYSYVLSSENQFFEENLGYLIHDLEYTALYRIEYFVCLSTTNEVVDMPLLKINEIYDIGIIRDLNIKSNSDSEGLYLLLRDYTSGKEWNESEIYARDISKNMAKGIEWINSIKNTKVCTNTNYMVNVHPVGPCRELFNKIA